MAAQPPSSSSLVSFAQLASNDPTEDLPLEKSQTVTFATSSPTPIPRPRIIFDHNTRTRLGSARTSQFGAAFRRVFESRSTYDATSEEDSISEPLLASDALQSEMDLESAALQAHVLHVHQTEYNYDQDEEEESLYRLRHNVDNRIEVQKRATYGNFSTIDWNHDLRRERARLSRLRKINGIRGKILNSFDAMSAWIIVFIVGICVALTAACIDTWSDWLSDLKRGYCKDAYWLSKRNCCFQVDSCDSFWIPWSEYGNVASFVIFVVASVLFATISAFLVKNYATLAAGSGIPEIKTILAGYIYRKYLGFWTLLIKSVGLSLSVASGLALGKEGPLVHVAACFGNVIPRLSAKYAANEGKKREVLSAAAAAGVSVAFGAPLGGVLFSLEEVSYYFQHKTLWRSFFCALVAFVTLQAYDPFRTGKLVLFQFKYDGSWMGFELVPYALLGIFGGIYGAFYIHFNLMLNKWRKRSWIRSHPIYEVTALSLITAIINYNFELMSINATELVARLFSRDTSFSSEMTTLAIVAALKAVLSTLTFGIKVPAGAFIPSMVVGACIGRILGIGIEHLHSQYPRFFLFSACIDQPNCIVPATYAMVGAAAALAGVTRMTVSLVVIMFELTGSLNYVPPLMIAVMFAKWVGDAIVRPSIYDGFIELNDLPFLDPKSEYTHSYVASHVMTDATNLEVLTTQDNTIASLEAILLQSFFKGFPVVQSLREPQLVGYITRTDLKYALKKARQHCTVTDETPCTFVTESHIASINSSCQSIDLRPWMDTTPMQVSHKFGMDVVVDMFKKLGLRYVLVTRNGLLLGLITKKDVLRHLDHRR